MSSSISTLLGPQLQPAEITAIRNYFRTFFSHRCLESVFTEASEEERRPSAILQRANFRARKDFWKPKVFIAPRAQAIVQGARVNGASSEDMVSKPQSEMEAL